MRLTKSVKDELIKAVVRATFAEKWKALKDEEVRLGETIYDALYPAETPIDVLLSPREVLEFAPDGFFTMRSDLCIQIEGEKWNESTISLAYPRRVAYKHYYSRIEKDEFDERVYRIILDNYFNLKRKRQKVELEKADLKEKLRVFLAPFCTYNKLFTEWPEAANYIKIPETNKNLPAVLVDEVRETLARIGKIT